MLYELIGIVKKEEEKGGPDFRGFSFCFSERREMRKIRELICDFCFEIFMYHSTRGHKKASQRWANIFMSKYNKLHGTNMQLVLKE